MKCVNKCAIKFTQIPFNFFQISLSTFQMQLLKSITYLLYIYIFLSSLTHQPPGGRIRPQKSYFFPSLKTQTKRVCIEMQLGIPSVNTPKNIFYLEKIYATLRPFPLQLLDQLIRFSRDRSWRRIKHQEKVSSLYI
jgi:hypothetical protein